jgi:PilZ domain
MNSKRRIRAREFINDLRVGMDVSGLMAKYRLTTKGLRTAFQKLVEVDAMSSEELSDLKSLYDASGEGLRRFRRKPMKFPIKIFDGGDPFKSGSVKDISEKGLCVREIEARIGEEKSFIIRLGSFGDSSTIVFQARCRWVKKSSVTGKTQLAGFEIIDISSLDFGQLNRLISK